MSAAHCGNCGAKLLGPWCAQCGQPAHASARGFGALLQDGWHTLTHLDGRFWRTFGALLLRPGHLTAEYFAGRRQRYLPPVRLYLVLSVLFFSLAGPGSPPTAGPVSATPPPGGAVEVEVGRCELRLGIGGLDGALQRGCQRVMQGDSRALSAALRDNIPRMMFVFLPLLAAVMLLLYWRPRRLYLEHLVFDAPGIRRFRAIQHRVGEIEVHLVRAPEFQESTLDALRERMRDAYGDGVRLQFRFVDDIPLTPAGKLRVAISTLATSATSAVAQWTDRLHESGVDALALHLV